jgi:glycosyltransferase involved in cell wall biosynthesis
MREWGVDATVVPNGLHEDAFEPPSRAAVAALRGRFRGRTVLTKMARFDPHKRWLETVGLVAELKRAGWQPLLVARGGCEPHGDDVRAAMRTSGLRVVERRPARAGQEGLVAALCGAGDADVIELRNHVDPDARRVLFRGADAVLANSGHEPFGLVGLEAMAAGGLACTGCSGEDYALGGHNALVLETGDPREFIRLFDWLRRHPNEARAMRRAGQATARRYAWDEVVRRALLPRLGVAPRRVATVAPRARSPGSSRERAARGEELTLQALDAPPSWSARSTTTRQVPTGRTVPLRGALEGA